MPNHLCRLIWVQELIVSAAVFGAGLGSAIGGWFSDKVGRKKALLAGDILFAVGALLMAAAHSPHALIAGLHQSSAYLCIPAYLAVQHTCTILHF